MQNPAPRPECLIIAAGKGSRLSALGEPKPLVPLSGRPLISWVMESAAAGGAGDFVVVTGYLADRLRSFFHGWSRPAGRAVRFIQNALWERENGISVAQASGRIRAPFVLLMSDHLFDPGILRRLIAEPLADDEVILAVDRRVKGHPTADLDDVTRVLAEGNRIRAIGKNLERYNAFDTGIFYCSAALFDALAESSLAGDHSLSGGIRVLAARGKARVFDVGESFWIDVDDEAAYARAERMYAPGRPRPGGREARGFLGAASPAPAVP